MVFLLEEKRTQRFRNIFDSKWNFDGIEVLFKNDYNYIYTNYIKRMVLYNTTVPPNSDNKRRQS